MLALGLIIACLVGEAAVLRVGIDDLDEGYFIQQAVRVLDGQIPYRDFQSLYTPGLAYLHAAVFGWVGGPFVLAPRALSLAARAALALLLFGIARPLVVRRPLLAALPSLFVLVGLDDAPVLWEPHPGWLSTLFAVLAAWCLSHQPTPRWLAATGLAAGMSYVFKQNTGVFILAAIVLWAAAARKDRLKRVIIPLACFAAFTAVWLGPLVVALRGEIGPLAVLVGAVNQAGLFFPPELPVLVPALCLVGGVWFARCSTDPRLRWYVLAGSALFLTQYPRMDALHLVWSAPLLLVSGAVALDRMRPTLAGLILLGAFALTTPTVTSRVAALGQPRVPISNAEVRYAGGIEVPEATRSELQGIVAEIQARTQPDEPIFVYPSSPLLYVLAERPNPTRFDHLNPGAADPRQIEQVIRDLDAAAVRLVVVSDFWRAAWGPPGPNAVLETWLDGRFTEVARRGAYRVLMAAL
jgi:hypothetical protein